MTTQTDPDSVFLQYRPKRRLAVVLVVLGAVAALVVAVYAVRATVFTPEATVTAYFDALADRDPAAALDRVAPEAAGDVLADRAVFRSEQYAPPGDVEVADVTVDGGEAVATVSYTLDGQERRTELRLRRDDGIVDSLVHRWLLIDAVGSVQIGEAPEEITLAGERLAAHDSQGRPRTWTALPGAYQLGVPADDPLWDARSTTARVEPAAATEVNVPMAPRPEVRPEVERQLTERLDRCADSSALVPPGCPFANTRISEANDVEWEITAYPRIGIAAGSYEGGRVAMLVTTTTEGEAVVTGTWQAFGAERPFETTVPFPVTGVVSARDGAIVFEPDW